MAFNNINSSLQNETKKNLQEDQTGIGKDGLALNNAPGVIKPCIYNRLE